MRGKGRRIARSTKATWTVELEPLKKIHKAKQKYNFKFSVTKNWEECTDWSLFNALPPAKADAKTCVLFFLGLFLLSILHSTDSFSPSFS